ncbi:ABC transporter ATP-binding protein [Malacoplasma muris]|uniref:ABC transporter ATP-binding protein n=1 Tax=Malacoplasma muris TaxID=2119 RepID=UPI00398F5CB3
MNDKNKKNTKDSLKKRQIQQEKTKKIYAVNDFGNELTKKDIKKIINDNKPHKGQKQVNNTEGNIIELTNVEKTFTNGYIANHVLKDINITIKEGQFVVILGKSGSGKTTLMNILSGLSRASCGSTIVANTNLINLTNSELTLFRRSNIGYIFQEYGLLGTLTVYENVLTGFNLNKKNRDKKIVDEIIDMVGLTLYKNKFPSELSGGQQQRVAIARAVAKNPKIIFGDEPTGAVDSQMSKKILTLLKKINKENNTTIVIITHDKNIAKIADLVFIISDGQIKETIVNKKSLDVKDL